MPAFKLSDPAIKELSIVFARKDGAEWSPRNDEARVLAVKGGQKPFVAQVVDKLKGYFQPSPEIGQYPVTADVADDIDHDGDGPEDYNQIVCAVCILFNDLQAAHCISDDVARSIAIKCAIDSFLEGLDALRAGEGEDKSEKAGARHSSSDTEHLNAIAAAVDAIGGALKNLGITGAEGPVEGETGPEEDDGPNNSQVDDDAEKAHLTEKAYISEFIDRVGHVEAVKVIGSEAVALFKADKKPYGDVEYADPGYQEDKKKRYPLDTEEHVRAAASYFGMEKNRSKYTAEQQKEIDAKIRAAEKKFGIGDDAKKGDEVEMNREEVAAMIAEAVNAAKASAKEEVRAELQPEIEAAKSDAQAAKAEADKQRELAEAYKSQATQNAGVIAALGGSATGRSALSASVQMQKSGLAERMIQEMRNNPDSTRF